MNETQYEKVRTAVKAAQEKGLKIVRGQYGIFVGLDGVIAPKKNAVCALGACVLGRRVQGNAFLLAIEDELGCSYDDGIAFTDGFDDKPHEWGSTEWYAAGKRLAAEVFGARGLS